MTSPMHRIDRSLMGLLSIATVVGLLRLVAVPPLWWDEGWTLTLARNWVELGHYGLLLAGERASPGLAAAFPVVAPIALSFRLLGVGVWQGRLIGLVYTLATLALLCYLARRLYDRSVAIWTLAILLLMSPIHPVVVGRQVLGEVPALFYLLAGYVCFLSAVGKSLWFMPVAVGLWGIALNTKAQVLPFWVASLLLALMGMLFRRSWKTAGLLVVGLSGSLVMSQWLQSVQQLFLDGRTVPGSPIDGLYYVTAFVPGVIARVRSVLGALLFGLPTILGLFYESRKFIGSHDKDKEGGRAIDLEVVRLALLALAGSWLAWYVLFSVGWPRYLFPATFIGSIFVAVMLRDLTDDVSLSCTIGRAGSALRYSGFNRQSTGALLATVLIAATFGGTLKTLYRSYIVEADTSALVVADFLNTHTAPDALVETYDSELFFLLDRRYHYPPDQIHVDLNRRAFLSQDVPIDYDPLTADPDYLVVGPYSKLWHLYDPVLATGRFRLIRAYHRYDVYERVR